MAVVLPSTPARSTPKHSRKLSIQTTLTTPRAQIASMDIADVKLHKLMPLISVKELPSSPISIMSSGSFSSVSSVASSYKAIYPPDSPGADYASDGSPFGPQSKEPRLGSIDQLIEWSRNIDGSPVEESPTRLSDVPPTGSPCPILSKIPSKVMSICGCAWSRVHQRMSLQLLCRGVENCSEIGLYEVACGPGSGTFVAVILLYPRHMSKAGMLEKRMREIADQEWKDMPPVRVWWVDEQPGQSISAPMLDESDFWNPINFNRYQDCDEIDDIFESPLSRAAGLPGARLSRSRHTSRRSLRSNLVRRKSSFPLHSSSTPSEGYSPTSQGSALSTEELDAKLNKLILSG